MALSLGVASTAATPAASSGAAGIAGMFGSLLLVIALIFALAWLLRRMQSLRGLKRSSLQLLGGIAVGNKERVVLVQCGEHQLLLGVAAGSVSLLKAFDAPAIEADADARVAELPSFAQRLRDSLGRHA